MSTKTFRQVTFLKTYGPTFFYYTGSNLPESRYTVSSMSNNISCRNHVYKIVKIHKESYFMRTILKNEG